MLELFLPWPKGDASPRLHVQDGRRTCRDHLPLYSHAHSLSRLALSIFKFLESACTNLPMGLS